MRSGNAYNFNNICNIIYILYTYFQVSKNSLDQKQLRIDETGKFLELLNGNKPEYLRRCVKMDVSIFSLRTSTDSLRVDFKRQQPGGKVLTAKFWDTQRAIFIDFFEKVKPSMAVITQFYQNHLKKENKVQFHYDNACYLLYLTTIMPIGNTNRLTVTKNT